MGLTLDDWRRLYEICDPTHRLHVDELDLFVERPDSVAKRIAATLRAGFDKQGKWIICGSVGAGKSTEMTKLADSLRDEFVVVWVDLGQTKAPAAILSLIGERIVRFAEYELGHAIDAQLVQELHLSEHRVNTLAEVVNDAIEEVRRFGKPLILVDGLDRLDRIDAIHDVFVKDWVIASLRAPVICTGPVMLMLDRKFVRDGIMVERLSNMAVARPNASMREFALQVVKRRCERVGVEFDAAFDGESLALLVRKSGGVMRQFLMLLRGASKQAGLCGRERVEIDVAEAACEGLRREFEFSMTAERRAEIVFIEDVGEPRGGRGSQEVLLWNFALPYANGECLFAPNPVIRLDK